jgi:Na+-transporting NADH:ubiquinone oxidoreductase subunit NqrB
VTTPSGPDVTHDDAPGGARIPRHFDNRYLAPILVTLVLIIGQISFGFLESWSRTALAISTAILVEIGLGRLFFGKWPHLASSYISGISIGMLIRSPEVWPYALCAAISITSKYVLRIDGRHLWNPSNFGIVAMLVLASDVVASLSVQWGNNLLPVAVVWLFGSVIIHRIGRFHITLTYVASFLAFSLLRAAITGHPWAAEVAPLTGPMYQLLIFFMITDPKTTVSTKRGQCLVVFLVAAMEAALRLLEFVHAPYYALFIVGPIANFVEIVLARQQRNAPAQRALESSDQKGTPS